MSCSPTVFVDTQPPLESIITDEVIINGTELTNDKVVCQLQNFWCLYFALVKGCLKN